MELLFYSVLLGYLVGSISPGYFLGQIVKRVDIRKFGNHNTGATNTYYTVGPVYGIIAGLFDFLKSLAVYLVALKYFSLSPNLAILPGLVSVVGHNWPFYLKFKGGKGAASLGGLILAVIISNQSWPSLLFVAVSSFYLLRISKKLEGLWSSRKTLKLSALILPYGFIEISPKFFISITAILLFFFITLDIIRFANRKFNNWYIAHKTIAKEKEIRRLSGYTLFLLSTLILFVFFPKDIALVSLTFFILADLIGPIGGKLFFKKEITHDKTWGGALSIFLICIIAGIFMKSLSSISIGWDIVFVGSLVITFLDQLSFILDDNILVPIGTALMFRLLLG
jgi:acyl-phosphate glycerol 3-phosphate acyltransferase